MKKCTECIHFEVCCYIDPNLPVCDSFMDQSKIVPCSVGDEAYVIAYSTNTRVIQIRVSQIQFIDNNIYIWIENMENTFDFWKLTAKEYNESCFLTREEAEKKLEELK